MKFGVILPSYGSSSTSDEIVETSLSAQRLGFDSIWTTDHILLPQRDSTRFGRIWEAMITLAYLAGKTDHIHLGVSSLVLPQRNPVIIAKQIAALDVLSNGRTILCVGVGWSAGEYANLGQRFEDRGRRMDEAIRVMRSLWASPPGETVTFKGSYYSFEDAVFSPPPIQIGGPPLWVAGHSETAMQRAADLADGWHPSSLPLNQFRFLARRFQDLAGGKERTISARLQLSFDPSVSDAQLRGTANEIIDTLFDYQDAGLEYAVIRFSSDSSEFFPDAMQRFKEEIAPAFEEAH